MKTYDDIGIQIPLVYLPNKSIDLTKWAVIACDQFTSEPEYWRQVGKFVGDAPSTLNLILPEAYLENPDAVPHLQRIHTAMRQYLDQSILQPREGIIYVERTVSGKTRRGIMLCLDLECYDYTAGSATLIRATEGTMFERVYPRVKIRDGAPLELPHILVLIDDPQHTVIEPLAASQTKLEKLYDFDLMLGSGHLTGYAVDESLEGQLITALRGLAKRDIFAANYGVGRDRPVLLFAMGDGNHSLATAKMVWEKIKSEAGMDHPARYALVEVENIHDNGLEFEPIHRLLFGLKKDILVALKSHFGTNYAYRPMADAVGMVRAVDQASEPRQAIGLVSGGQFGVVEIANPSSNLPVGTLQAFLDLFLKEGGAEKMDYLHGEEVVIKFGAQAGNAGFYLPTMNKSDLFKTVILDGALPRKTFSMGEAKEKRFYMEARKIV